MPLATAISQVCICPKGPTLGPVREGTTLNPERMGCPPGAARSHSASTGETARRSS